MDWLFWLITGVSAFSALALVAALIYAFLPIKIETDRNNILNDTLNSLDNATHPKPPGRV